MNLLLATTAFPPSVGGVQIHGLKLASTLLLRHQVEVVTLWNENRTDWLLGTTLRMPAVEMSYSIDGIDVHRLGLPFREKLWMAPWVLLHHLTTGMSAGRIAAGFEPGIDLHAADADVIHSIRMGREHLSVAAFRCARRRDLPFVITPVHHPRWSGWRQRVYVDLYRKADAVIAMTEAERGLLTGMGVPGERVFVTGIGPVLSETANPEEFRERHALDGPIVLFLGQHYRYKGYRELLAAARIVWNEHPDANFVFIGPAVGDSERWFALHADRRVSRLGQVDLQTKTDALAACSILCVPSVQESFGGVYTEAWAFAKPVVACPIPATSEVVDHGVDGILVDQTPRAIAAALTELLESPVHASELGARGQEKMRARYTWQHIASRTEEAYVRASGA